MTDGVRAALFNCALDYSTRQGVFVCISLRQGDDITPQDTWVSTISSLGFIVDKILEYSKIKNCRIQFILAVCLE